MARLKQIVITYFFNLLDTILFTNPFAGGSDYVADQEKDPANDN